MWGEVCSKSRKVLFGMAVALCLGLVQFTSAGTAQAKTSKAAKDVYVCDCQGTSSCPCMAMANKEGKCPCGKEMKAVPRNSAWAKHNRREL